jgi:predicted aspartyl protease
LATAVIEWSQSEEHKENAMRTATLGRVVVPVTIENQYDLYEVSQGKRKADEVRRIDIPDAVVDTGAKMLSLPRRYIQQLGLQFIQARSVITSAGPRTVDTFRLVKLKVMDREAPLDVAALPDECPVLIGYITLEQMDLVVDPIHQQLIGDPFHNGESLIDMF